MPPTSCKVRVLRQGEAALLWPCITQVDAVLFRPLTTETGRYTAKHSSSALVSPAHNRHDAHKNECSHRNTKPIMNDVATGLSGRTHGATRTSITSVSDTVNHHASSVPSSHTVGMDADAACPHRADTRAAVSKSITAAAASVIRSEKEPPLFFDTTAMLFHKQHHHWIDYVATGHSVSIELRGLSYQSHAVVLGNETRSDGYAMCKLDMLCCNNNDEEEHTRQQGSRGTSEMCPCAMAAGDSVRMNLSEMATCEGALVAATLFTHACSCERLYPTTGTLAYYMIRDAMTRQPFCLIPLRACSVIEPSTVALMIRQRCIAGVCRWEVVRVSEPMCVSDVRSVLLSLHRRGLRDPACYRAVLVEDEMGAQCETSTERSDPNTEIITQISLATDADNSGNPTQPSLAQQEQGPITEKDEQQPQQLLKRVSQNEPSNLYRMLHDCHPRGHYARSNSITTMGNSATISHTTEVSQELTTEDTHDSSTGNAETTDSATLIPTALLLPRSPELRRTTAATILNASLHADEPQTVTQMNNKKSCDGCTHDALHWRGCAADSIEIDAITTSALRTVMPLYDDTHVVRYANGTYNVGTPLPSLTSHYVQYREKYALAAAVSSRSDPDSTRCARKAASIPLPRQNEGDESNTCAVSVEHDGDGSGVSHSCYTACVCAFSHTASSPACDMAELSRRETRPSLPGELRLPPAHRTLTRNNSSPRSRTKSSRKHRRGRSTGRKRRSQSTQA